MGTAADALRVAASQIGVTETPLRSNNTPYTQWYGMRGAWCSMFVGWVLAHSGTPQGSGKGFAWASSHRDWLASQGRVHSPSQAQPGDLCWFEWGTTPGGYDHVGIIERIEGSTVVTIEGNVQDRVQRLRRPKWSGILEVGRPAYSPSRPPVSQVHPVIRQGSRGAAVGELQHKLNKIAGAGLAVDGVFGPKTRTAVLNFQRFFGLAADGIVGPQTWGWIDALVAFAG